MRLTERLALVAADAKQIRESITFHDPRAKNFDESYGLGRDERLVGRTGPRWDSQVLECAQIFDAALNGRRWKGMPGDYVLREAMTTSDFPLLFGDLLYRQLLGNYMPYPVTYPKYFRIVDLKDFRKLHMYTIDGGQGILNVVKEREPYPETKFIEGQYSVAVVKYGRRYGISFEMVINDDLNAFQQRPALMATGARRTEEYLATTMLCDVNGPHASFFTVGNANIVTGNPALSTPGLQTAFKILAAQKDKDGQPIVIDAVNLVVTPNDEITAQNILHASQLRINDATGGGSSGQFLYVENWMKAKVTLSVNPYIPYVASSATANPWFLIANPNDMTQRPAFVFGFLKGRRQPQLFIKDPDQRMLGGGNSDPMEGDFDTDSIDYKLRHIMGAAQIDPKMAVSSNSTGS
jgi:hypothetical protein